MTMEHGKTNATTKDYQTLFDLLPLMYFVVDETGRILSVNQAGADALGYENDELIGTPVYDIFVPEDREPVRQQIAAAALNSNRIAQWEFRKTRKDGSTLWVRETARPARRTDGSLVFHIICEDITQTRLILEQLQYAEAKYRSLVEQVPAISYAVDIGLIPHTTFISPQVEYLLGYTPEEWIQDPSFWHQCIHRDDRQRVLDEVSRNNLSGAPFFLEYRIRTKDGQYRWIRNHGVYRRDETGAPRYTHGVMIDITDTKRIEEREQEVQARLMRAERMESLGLMAGGVAHDLNNILGPLVGYPDLLLQELSPGHEAAKDLRMMRDAALRASDIIQDLLTLARRSHVPQEPVDLNQVIQTYLSTPEYKSVQDRYPLVDVAVQLDEDLPPVNGATPQLMQVVVNLVQNAFESIEERGQITISTSREYVERPVGKFDTVKEEECVVLRVQDTGCGIAQEDIDHVFDPFFTRKRLHRTGTGLGLSIVYGVIKDMRGSVDLQSRVNEGSVFSLFMPIAGNVITEEAEMRAPPQITGSERLLVVDDLSEQRDLARRILSNLGYDVQVAAGHDDALDLIRQTRFDLVILDMIIEGGPDGLDIYKDILRIAPGQRCIIISGFAETERVREAKVLGAHNYIRKPYTMQKLGGAVRAALDQETDASA